MARDCSRRPKTELTSLSGAEFDRQFVASMVMDHEKDVATFKVQAEHDESHSLSPATAHAKETLPALEEHLAMAQSLSASPPLR